MYLRKKSWHRRVKYSLKAVEAKVITKAIQGIGDVTEYRSSQWFSSHKSVLFFAAAALPKRGSVAALSWSLVLSEWTSWAAERPRMYFPGSKLSMQVKFTALLWWSGRVCDESWWIFKVPRLEAMDFHFFQSFCLKVSANAEGHHHTSCI